MPCSGGVTPAIIAERLGARDGAPVTCETVEPSLEDVFLDVAERSAAS